MSTSLSFVVVVRSFNLVWEQLRFMHISFDTQLEGDKKNVLFAQVQVLTHKRNVPTIWGDVIEHKIITDNSFPNFGVLA